MPWFSLEWVHLGIRCVISRIAAFSTRSEIGWRIRKSFSVFVSDTSFCFRGARNHRECEGLGLFEGTVQRFRAADLKVPQIGWNRVNWTAEAYKRFPELPIEPFVYFVHSYYPVPAKRSIIAATAEYGEEFAAAIVADNLLATQFHPEKSQENGLAILRQFVSSLSMIILPAIDLLDGQVVRLREGENCG